MVDESNGQNPPRTTSISIDVLATQFMNKVFSRKEESRRSKRTTLPWESWELDEQFFRTLSRWTMDNPETSLDRVLDNICDGLESSKDLLSLVPENPFPARGLVMALGYLFKLGVTILRATKAVQGFAKDVIRWVGEVKSAFDSQEDGRFTRMAWRDLKHMRDLVNEICMWAVERLEDGRWSRIGHGLRIQGEIQEFYGRIADARALFRDLSAINLAKGLDAILANLRKLLQRQRSIIDQIQKIQKTQKKHLGQIMDELESRKLAAKREQFLVEALAGHAIIDPTYDKQGKRPCDPDTRVEVLQEIREWIKQVSPGSKNFLWLTGDPGCGKSAVTASVSKECKKEDILWAQFFINRNNVETTDPNSYFPSIASQLARRSPKVAEALQGALRKDRTLTDGISSDQAAKLFIDTIRCASQLDPQKAVMVVIDGLDETDRKRLKETAKIFSTLFSALTDYANVKVFISSRTENDIRNSFIRPSHDKHVKRIHLDTASSSSIQDVSHYIKRNLLELVTEHDLNWAVWPGHRRSQVLGERASGLFIWGVTAIKFIQERLDCDGTECLDEVLDLLTADVLHDVNALYALILQVTYGSRPSTWEFERFRRIIGAVVSLQEPLCIDDLATLLDLHKTPSTKQVDVLHFVRRFRTILVTGTGVIDGKSTPRIHKSVFEFLTSDSVDTRFRIVPEHAHLEVGIQCLSQLALVPAVATTDTLPLPFRYAFRFWSSHLSQAGVLRAGIACADCRHSPSQPLHSLPLRATISAEPPTRVRYSSNGSQIRIMRGDSEYVRSWDALSGIILLDRATHLAFSPDGTQIASCSRGKLRLGHQWVRPLAEYSSPISCITFSPDGKSIVSGSEDGSLCLWDSSTGACIVPLRGHKGSITCVAFSPNAQHLVSGSDDKTCILWNVRSGERVGKPWVGHQYSVISIAFSARSRQVCSDDYLGYCIIWNVSNGRKVRSWQYDGMRTFISFSPKKDGVIVMGGGQEIEVRSNDHQWVIPDSAWAQCMSFSSDGKRVIFGTDNIISVADIGENQATARIIRKGYFQGGHEAEKLTFSPDFRYLAYVDNNIHVYALEHNETSLNIVPVTELLPTTQSNNESEKKSIGALSNLREVWFHDNTLVINRRLDATKWYKANNSRVAGDAGSASKLWVVTDNAIIAAYNNGAVSVWSHST